MGQPAQDKARMILDTRLKGWEHDGRTERYAGIQARVIPAPTRFSLRESVQFDGIECIGEDGFSYGWISAKHNKELGASPLQVVRQRIGEDCAKGFSYKTAYAEFDRFDMIGAALTTTMMVRVYVDA